MDDLLADEERRTRDDSAEWNDKKRVRDESSEAEELDSPEVKRLRDDLLGVLDDSDPDPESQDLDSVMKSFEEELTAQGSGETELDLGYLLGASDDELGLPPPPANASKEEETETETEPELVRVSSDSSGIGEFWEFEDQVASYESFELGVGDGFVEVEGLFEDFEDRFETLPSELKRET